MDDLVSIVCPLHNKGRYICETIESVFQQTHQQWEMIVVENGSTDNGPDIVRQFDDPRIQLIEAPETVRGPGAARNVGIDCASGQWVLFLDADDLIEINHLQDLLAAAADPEIDIVASGWREFKVSTPDNFEIKEPMGRGAADFRLADHAIAFAPWAIHCALIRKSVLGDEMRWVEELDRYASEDTAFWFQVVCNKKVAYSEGHSAVYRVETDNFRNRVDDLEQWFDAMDAVVNANVNVLKSNGNELNAKQCESLMRLWEDVALRSRKKGVQEVEQKACSNAQDWLYKCKSKGGVRSLTMRVRDKLLIRRFLAIRNWLSISHRPIAQAGMWFQSAKDRKTTRENR